MPPKGHSKNSAKAQRAKARKERQLLEAQIKACQEKCVEARGYLEPTGRNAEPNFTKAKAALDAAIESYNENSFAFYLLGQWHRMQGMYEEAIESYTQALDLDPTNPQTLEWRAHCYQALHDYSHAIEDNTSIISLDPENDHAYNMRGLCVLQTNVPGLHLRSIDFQSCVHDFSTAVHLNEANYYAMANLGKVYEVQGDLDKAIECYGRVLDNSENYTYARFRRGCTALGLAERLLLRQGEEEEEEEEKGKGSGGSAPEVAPGTVKVSQSSSTQQIAGAASSMNNRVLKGPEALKEVKAEVLQQMEKQKEAQTIEKLLKLADSDFTKLLDCTTEEKKFTADVTVVLNIGICALLTKNTSRAEEYLKLVQEIVAKRPALVEAGEAPPIENADILNSVLDIRLKELQRQKDMVRSAA
ncbi:hypothetical protein JKF63_07004 [Porcisia hertigi]|uniref:Uncharacterized protein n=1 Tax=Porcisia hertigi TaxID=2761500 RepID=A0A836IUV6_9TRYP|nr:hypothetical protein JKF63_07004 [Porcisia hertigi]